jgi:hypothetical protein
VADPSSKTTIDEAIATCDVQITQHRKSGSATLLALAGATLLLVLAVCTFGWLLFQPLARLPEEKAISALFSGPFIYAVLAIFAIIFGVLMAIYRFHLTEIAKAEHNKIGFLRVRIAAHNSSPGYQTEVRQALVDGAFSAGSGLGQKTKVVESPIPGHPTSDVAAAVLDQVLRRFDLVEKKAAKE